MWNKVERFILVVGVYNYLTFRELEVLKSFNLDLEFIENNCLYTKESINLQTIESTFDIFEKNFQLYQNKLNQYLNNSKLTPVLVQAILFVFLLEFDFCKNHQNYSNNFLGKYPRLAQELIAGEYTSLCNAIIRKFIINEGFIQN